MAYKPAIHSYRSNTIIVQPNYFNEPTDLSLLSMPLIFYVHGDRTTQLYKNAIYCIISS